MSTNTGGPAFPAQEQIDYPSCSVTQHYPGMTLRDYFAAKAMGGLMADPSCEWSSKEIAIAAYVLADAMLAERAK